MAKVTGMNTEFYVWTGSGDPTSSDRISNMTEIGEFGWETTEVDASDLDSGEAGEFLPGPTDFGSFTFTGYANGANVQRLQSLRATKSANRELNFGVYTPGAEHANFKVKGYIASFQVGARTRNDLITFTGEVRVNGEPTWDWEPPSSQGGGD